MIVHSLANFAISYAWNSLWTLVLFPILRKILWYIFWNDIFLVCLLFFCFGQLLLCLYLQINIFPIILNYKS